MGDYTAAAVTEENKPSSTEGAKPGEPSSAAAGTPSSANPSSAAGETSRPPGKEAEGSAPPSTSSGTGEAQEAPDPLAEAQAEAARFKDQLLRVAADFDNFRKRTRRELEDAERRGRDDLLKELLPVFDNFERAATHASSADAASGVKALVEGIDLVMRQFMDTLKKLGIERVASVGQPFDPSVHEAIQHMESADFAPGTIAAEVQAGYRTAERLVRPALVVVAKAPAGAGEAGNGAGHSDDAN